MALDDDEQVRRLDARIEQRLVGAEVGDVDAVAHDALFGGVEAVEG